jgi:hypothetical protein
MKMLRLGIPDDGEEIAAHAAGDRLHQPQRRIGGNRRIDRRAAFLQNIDRDLGGERLHRGRHAMLGDHRRARRERRADIAVAIPSREALNCVQTHHQKNPCQFHVHGRGAPFNWARLE